MLYSLQKVIEDGYRTIVWENDSKMALEGNLNGFHPYLPFTKGFLNWKVTLQHILKEANFCANWLAKYGSWWCFSFLQTMFLWYYSPQQLIC